MHTQTKLDTYGPQPAITDYLAWVRSLFTTDGYNAYLQLFRLPLETNGLMDEVADKLRRMFDGRDAVYRYKFKTDERRDDYEEWRKQHRLQEKYEKLAFEAMHTGINSVFVVDSDPNAATSDPYFYTVNISRLYDYELVDRSSTQFEWIMFKETKTKYIVIDDERYRVLEFQEGQAITDAQITIDNPHTIGYCPARFFWEKAINSHQPHIKKSPYSTYLAMLDWLLQFGHNKQNLDLFAGNPIYSGIREDCDFEMDGPEDGEIYSCNGGYLVDSNDHHIVNGDRLHRCPKCNETSRLTPGTYVDVAPPSDENQFADLRNPISILTVDRPALDYNTEEKARLKSELLQKITGYKGEPINNQAVNQDQVYSFHESEANKLRTLKKPFENCQEWLEKTVSMLLYNEAPVDITINYGNEFYLVTPEALSEQYAQARTKGQPSHMLEEIEQQYFATRYRSNPDLLNRSNMIADLDPFHHVTVAQVADLLTKGAIEAADYVLKLNFNTLLRKFERENGPIENFGGSVEYATRIDRIQEAMRNYVTTAEPAPAPDPEPEPEPGGAPAPNQ